MTSKHLLQKPSCYILPLDMEAAHPVEPGTTPRWETGFMVRNGVSGKALSHIIWNFATDFNSAYSLK